MKNVIAMSKNIIKPDKTKPYRINCCEMLIGLAVGRTDEKQIIQSLLFPLK